MKWVLTLTEEWQVCNADHLACWFNHRCTCWCQRINGEHTLTPTFVPRSITDVRSNRHVCIRSNAVCRFADADSDDLQSFSATKSMKLVSNATRRWFQPTLSAYVSSTSPGGGIGGEVCHLRRTLRLPPTVMCPQTAAVRTLLKDYYYTTQNLRQTCATSVAPPSSRHIAQCILHSVVAFDRHTD